MQKLPVFGVISTPSAQLDELTVDQEHLFPYRFGFDANRSIRAQIIALKHQYDLTDMDITSLRHAGQRGLIVSAS